MQAPNPDRYLRLFMKQNPRRTPESAPTPAAPGSSLAAAFDRMAQKSGFESWKQLDREQPLPVRKVSPVPVTDPDAKPEPPKLSAKRAAPGSDVSDVSFADVMKGTRPLGATPKAPRK